MSTPSRLSRVAIVIAGLLVGASAVSVPLALAATSGSPPSAVPTPPPTWPTNPSGLTYGSGLGVRASNQEPELIEAIATNGQVGYVKRGDLASAHTLAANPQAALAQQSASVPSTTIPVYQVDGKTQIGVFVIGGGSAGAAPAPSASSP